MRHAAVAVGRMGRFGVASALGLGLILAACGPGAPPEEPGHAPVPSAPGALAVVNGEPIEAGDLRGAGPRGAGAEEWLEGAIARKLLAQEARRRHLDASPALRDRIAAIRSGARRQEEEALSDALFQSFREEVPLSDADLLAHYEETRGRYLERHYHYRRMVFDSEQAARAADDALGATGRLDPAAAEEVGPAAASDLPRAILPGALRLREPGERAVIGSGDGKWQLLELVETPTAVARPFEQVQHRVEESLRNRRAQPAFESLVERLRAEASVEIDKAALATVELPASLPPRSAEQRRPHRRSLRD